MSVYEPLLPSVLRGIAEMIGEPLNNKPMKEEVQAIFQAADCIAELEQQIAEAEVESEAKSICLDQIAEALDVEVPYGELYGEVNELKAKLAAAERWVSIDDRLPDSNVPVIAFVEAVDGVQGRTRRIRAQYAAKFTLPVSEQCDINDWSEWNEQDDECYCPAGWYETNEFEETNWAVSGTVTHWMPLPEPPSIAATDKEGK